MRALREREAGRIALAGSQYPVSPPLGRLDAGQPQLGLPDTRLALQHNGAGKTLVGLREAFDGRQLLLLADKAPSRRIHADIVGRAVDPGPGGLADRSLGHEMISLIDRARPRIMAAGWLCRPARASREAIAVV